MHVNVAHGGKTDDVAALDPTEVRALIVAYATAKSRQDTDQALSYCHPDFRLETIPFGTVGRGKEHVANQLRTFFAAFPDYAVTLEDMATSRDHLAAWGRARMTLQGALLGWEQPCRTAELPIFCVFDFADGLIASERFFFDLAALCGQAGVPIEVMQAALAQAR